MAQAPLHARIPELVVNAQFKEEDRVYDPYDYLRTNLTQDKEQ